MTVNRVWSFEALKLWQRFYHIALELSGRCALQIYLLTYLLLNTFLVFAGRLAPTYLLYKFFAPWKLPVFRSPAVASVRLVSPGAITGVTLLFLRKSDDFFSHRPQKWWPFWLSSATLSALQLIVSPIFFVNSSANNVDFHHGVSLLDGVTRGGPPPLVTPLFTGLISQLYDFFNKLLCSSRFVLVLFYRYFLFRCCILD